MKFVNKIKTANSFWVEDYTPAEKEIFIGLGFTEKKPNVSEDVAKAFKLKSTLNFQGSDYFGEWTQEEMTKIANAIYEKFPNVVRIKPEQMNHFE